MMTGAERTAAYRQRKRDAGYRLVHGYFTLDPPKPRPPAAHGTQSRYTSPKYRCRCDECRAAASAASVAWQRANRDHYNAYQRTYQREWRAARAKRAAS